MMLRPTAWTPWVERVLETIRDADKGRIDAWRMMVAGERSQLVVVEVEGAPVGVLIWDIEAGADSPAIVVRALAASTRQDHDIAKMVMEALRGFGRSIGADRLIFWTKRAGLVRRAAREYGATASQVVEVPL